MLLLDFNEEYVAVKNSYMDKDTLKLDEVILVYKVEKLAPCSQCVQDGDP